MPVICVFCKKDKKMSFCGKAKKGQKSAQKTAVSLIARVLRSIILYSSALASVSSN